MGNKNYSGGNSLLNNEAGFTTFDPAEEQKKTDLHSEHSNTRFRSPPRYFIQVQQQLKILLQHIANGNQKPHIPMIFKEEIGEFNNLQEWARSKPEYEGVLKQWSNRAPKTFRKKKTLKQNLVARKIKVGRIEPRQKASKTKTSKSVEQQNCSLTEKLEELEALMEELREERTKPWHSERKKQAITERYHSVKKKHDALWLKFHKR